MKKYSIFLLLLLLVKVSFSQQFSAQAFLQQTVLGAQSGYGIRYQNSKEFGVGILYQNSLKSSKETNQSDYIFYGVETLIPLTKCHKVRLFLTPKIGFVNQVFFVVIPEIETKIEISDRFSTGITAGIRARQSAVGARLIMKIN